MTSLVARLESYLRDYVTFADDAYVLPSALWIVGTYLWPHFDAYPYLVITSDVKRSGKTRFSEVLSFAASNPRNFAGMTPATLFRSIRDENPTVIIDEAETLSSEAANTMRAVLNVGYRKGQSIPRLGRNGVVEWPAYCPKVFVLIGDVYDTLKDRSIVVRMQRAEPARRFLYDVAKSEGWALGEAVTESLEDARGPIVAGYQSHPGLSFLSDRDAEIWIPLFAIAAVLVPDRIDALQRAAVDLATEKTAESRRYVNLLGAERKAEDDEYARRLLRDVCAVFDGKRSLYSADAVTLLHAVPTAPWRKYRGDGLSAMDMANLLSRFGVKPRLIRRGQKVARGYYRADCQKALQSL